MIDFLRDYVFTLIESILLYCMVYNMLSCKFNGSKRWGIISTAIIMDSLFVHFCPISSMLVRIILFFVVSFTIISIIFNGRIYLKSLFILLSNYILLISDIIAGNLISYISRDNIEEILNNTILALPVLSKFVSLVLVLLSIHFFKKIKLEISKSYWIILNCIIALFIMLLIFIMQINSLLQEESNIFSIYIFWVSIGFLVMSLLVIYFFIEICNFYEIEKKNTILNLKTKAFEQQIAHQKTETMDLKKIRHDINKNLAIISSLLKQNNISDSIGYINSITLALEETKPIVNSGNNLIDAILNYKIAVCKKNHIKLQISIDNLPELNIEPIDLAAIVSNILDNAIEANANISLSDRFISIKIFCYKNYLSIVVKNPYCSEILRENDLIKTNKLDTLFHGYGMRSVKSSAEKYLGFFKFFTENNIFTATVMLPIEVNAD